ncbi:MAG: membrane protein of unknown function [Promethearchaeota archaeon]|nr:MAG: membrane protein of unknown function [Candidatus Lokiarchaeota archaeon]
MIIEITRSQELQFLFFLAPVLIGIQLSIYFYYQYFKLYDNDLYLNKILLSYGTFALCIIVATLLLQNARLFQSDPEIIRLISKIGWILMLLAPILFLIFITNKAFEEVLNIKICILVMVLNLIPLAFAILLYSTEAVVFRTSIVLMILSLLYIIYIQLNIIRKTKGVIKKRFTRFLIGEGIAISSLFFAYQVNIELFPTINEIIFYSGIIILTIGFLIIFVSLYNFPPFYEFQWRESLSKLYIINQKTNNCIYFCDFQKALKDENYFETSKQEDFQYITEDIFSEIITGVEMIIDNLTNTEEDKIIQIQQEESILFFDHGKQLPYISYILMVEKDLRSHYSFLRQIKTQFESFFEGVLENIINLEENPGKLFKSFDIVISQMIR